ncbi:STM4015 family protein [Nonomuraea sp. SBT364]|uniref:STM4015 family protein n=1 Tax=Nonomuraea sp. SBT364 TaxID=1580530 RepID=UPI00069D4EC2|nr:STM4015 family protein [Nonomuraea sp. SBT364]
MSVEFDGLPIVEAGDRADDPARAAWELFDQDGEESHAADELDRLLADVGGEHIRSVVIAGTGAAGAPEALAARAAELPHLRSVFLGNAEPEVAEISWITHADITPLLTAFPRLRRLDVRGASGLTLRPVRHEGLTMLRFESGGLPAEVVRALSGADLPALEHLELWLGESYYGGDATVADLGGVLSGERLPALRHLGLQDSEIQDEIAAAVASAPVVARLESLALGMGVLTDVGAEALLGGQPLTHLRALDLGYHFLSEAMAARVRQALPGVAVDLSDPQLAKQEDEWRFVAVGE